jgi:DNA repair protein RadD
LAAVQALFDYWMNNTGNPVVAMPTGTGKSLVIAEFIRRALLQYPGTRILVLTHVKELVGQNFEKLLELWPTAPAGIFSAGLRRRDLGRAATFCGIGSVAKRPELFGRVDLVLIDECHTVSAKETTQYQRFINALKRSNPLLKIAGLTATPYRLGQGMIVEPGGLFSDICFDITSRDEFNQLIAEGYLAPLVPKKMKAEFDVSGVKMTAGDFNAKDLAAAVDKEAITRAACEEMVAYGTERKSWLVFASGIQHAEHVALTLAEMGISAVAIHSKSGDEARDEAVAAFKSGEIRALVNNGVFTTGFDFPGIDMIAVLHPTASPGLWVQMLGRGTRPLWLPGFDISTIEGRLSCIMSGPKRNCLVLDFAGNTRRLGPINDPKKPKTKGKGPKGDVPAKVCATCMTFNHVSARHCCECGAEFPFKVKLEREASEDELIAGNPVDEAPKEPVTEWFHVKGVTYSKHVPFMGKRSAIFKSAKPNMRVSYDCGIRSFTEHVCFEHEGAAKASARQFWLEAGGPGLSIPQTVDEALARTASLMEPQRVRVWINRQHPQIMFREFDNTPANLQSSPA